MLSLVCPSYVAVVHISKLSRVQLLLLKIFVIKWLFYLMPTIMPVTAHVHSLSDYTLWSEERDWSLKVLPHCNGVNPVLTKYICIPRSWYTCYSSLQVGFHSQQKQSALWSICSFSGAASISDWLCTHRETNWPLLLLVFSMESLTQEE